MAKCSTDTCCLTLPLRLEKWQEDRLAKRFEIARQIYNTMVRAELKKLRAMEQSEPYKANQEKIQALDWKTQADKQALKALYKERDKLLRDGGFSEYGFKSDIKNYYKHFNNNIGQTVRRYNERNRMDSLCDKMDILIKCKILGSAGKQVNFCSFRVYGFCIVQVIAIGNHRHTFIENCRDIILIRILCINLCFFYSEGAVTAHGVFTVSGYFGTTLDQNIASCP